jgi:hypothetical protein
VRRIVVLSVVTAMLVVGAIPVASAQGLTQEKLENAGWACGGDADLPPGHCVNPGGGPGENLSTFTIMVFGEDGDFHSAEGATFQASADTRPCPHDDESPDGTWWSPFPGLYVCHHR